jgi:hypothetical protein
MGKGQSVSVVNCAIKKSKLGSGYELIASEKTSIVASSKKFDVSDDLVSEKKLTYDLEKLDMIDETSIGNRVSIKGKVISLSDSEEIKSTLASGKVFVKKDGVISDESRASRLVLWENHVESVKCGKCYAISDVCIKSYSGQKYFSTTDDTTIQEIAEIGTVCQTINTGEEQFVGDIVGVISSNSYYSCISCSAKVDGDGVIGCCSKCGMKQKINRCKRNSVLQVMIENDSKIRKTVSMFGSVIDDLIKDEEDELLDFETKVLMSTTKIFTIRPNNTVLSVKNIDID